MQTQDALDSYVMNDFVLKYEEGRVLPSPEAIGPIWLTDVNCNGNESSLLDCPHSSVTSHCGHGQDVAVECANYNGTIKFPILHNV